MGNKKPNILMIMADQLPAYMVGAYGHPIVKTPNIDALCDTGVMFDSAYCNCPISAPSRASMCTGQFVSDVGAFDNGTDFLSSTPTFMHHLRRADYSVELAGKMHFIGPDQLHGFERRLTPEIYPSNFVWTPDWRQGAYHNPGTAVDQLKEAGLCKWSMQLDYDEEVTFRTLESLRDKARKSEEDPFFYVRVIHIRMIHLRLRSRGGICMDTMKLICLQCLVCHWKTCILLINGCKFIIWLMCIHLMKKRFGMHAMRFMA